MLFILTKQSPKKWIQAFVSPWSITVNCAWEQTFRGPRQFDSQIILYTDKTLSQSSVLIYRAWGIGLLPGFPFYWKVYGITKFSRGNFQDKFIFSELLNLHRIQIKPFAFGISMVFFQQNSSFILTRKCQSLCMDF